MHPLAIFPSLLTFGLLAPLLLRITIGIIRLFAGLDRGKKEYGYLSFLYIISSILIILGLYTQIAAIVALFLVMFDYYTEREKKTLTREKHAMIVLSFVILLSLLLTGPGLFAFDLPL